MPRIYELPASDTPENRSLVIEHTPGTVPGGARPGWGLPAQQKQTQHENVFKVSASMLSNLRNKEFNDVTREFDSQVAALDQQQLAPDKYKVAYARLQSHAAMRRTGIQAKHVANAQQIKIMQGLVEENMLDSDQMEQAILVMAGIPKDQVKAAYAQQKQRKPSTMLNELESENQSIQAWQEKFEDYRGPHTWRGKKREKLYYIGPTGTRRKAHQTEIDAFDESIERQKEISILKSELYGRLTPSEQDARRGTRAMEQFAMGREPQPPLAGQRFSGGIQFAEPALQLTSPAGEQPTEKEFRDTIAKLKTTGSTKKAKAYYDKWVDKIWPE